MVLITVLTIVISAAAIAVLTAVCIIICKLIPPTESSAAAVVVQVSGSTQQWLLWLNNLVGFHLNLWRTGFLSHPPALEMTHKKHVYVAQISKISLLLRVK